MVPVIYARDFWDILRQAALTVCVLARLCWASIGTGGGGEGAGTALPQASMREKQKSIPNFVKTKQKTTTTTTHTHKKKKKKKKKKCNNPYSIFKIKKHGEIFAHVTHALGERDIHLTYSPQPLKSTGYES